MSDAAKPSCVVIAALASFLLGGCERGSIVPNTNDPDSASGTEHTSEEGEGSSVAVVTDGVLDPDPEQLAAGVPYLRFRVDVSGSPARGPADAPVTIVMFSDFECPYCDEAFETVSRLQADYPEQIRFVYKALPLARHPHALEAALVGHSAMAQGKFWEFHDLIFSGGGGIDPASIRGYAQELGLDLGRIDDELESLVHAPALRRDLRTAKRLRLTSTPVFFVNGRMLPGARPKHIFEHLIEQELDLARRLTDEGIGRAGLYDYTTQWGYTAIVYADDREELDEDKVYPVPIDDSPTRGPADAPITIVAFSDFQCGFCVRGHATMEELRELYGDQVRFVFKHFPLPGHPVGALASRTSFAAARLGKFWEFHDAVFDREPRQSPAPEDLVDIALSLGVTPEALEQAMTTDEHDARINADIQLGGRLMISGTPAYFINGRPLVGAHPLIDFRLLIAEELERVAHARAQGVAAAAIYEHLTAEN